MLRLSLHPAGLAPRIADLGEWRQHSLARLRHQIEVTADAVLVDLLEELRAFPPPAGAKPPAERDDAGIGVPFQLKTDLGVLSSFSATTVFGTPVDVTLSVLALESFYLADAATGEALRRMAAAAPDSHRSHWRVHAFGCTAGARAPGRTP